jgi:hypothetical protein
MPLGITPAAALRLARDARAPLGRPRPLRIYGERADEVRAALAAGGDPHLVLVGGDVADASAIVCVVPGEPVGPVRAALRSADLRGVPAIALRLDGTDRPLPYVLATDVVAWPGGPPPLGPVARRLAERLRRDGRELAAALPALRPAVQRVLVHDTAVRGAVLVGTPGFAGSALPVLSLMQARLLLDLEAVRTGEQPSSPDEVALAVAPRLGLSTAVGVAAREAFRRLPRPLRRLAAPALAYAGTRTVGAVASRLPLPR